VHKLSYPALPYFLAFISTREAIGNQKLCTDINFLVRSTSFQLVYIAWEVVNVQFKPCPSEVFIITHAYIVTISCRL